MPPDRNGNFPARRGVGNPLIALLAAAQQQVNDLFGPRRSRARKGNDEDIIGVTDKFRVKCVHVGLREVFSHQDRPATGQRNSGP